MKEKLSYKVGVDKGTIGNSGQEMSAKKKGEWERRNDETNKISNNENDSTKQ